MTIQAALRLCFCLAGMATLSACASLLAFDSGCLGVEGDAELVDLGRRACTGSKLAQYELGRTYESGTGVVANAAEAAHWYRQAAESETGVTNVYSPPVGKEQYGRVIPVRTGPPRVGLPEAQYALGRLYLEGRGVKQSDRKARKWLKRAAQQDYGPALALLDERFSASTETR